MNFYKEIEENNNFEKQNLKRQQSIDLILNRFGKEKICCIGKKNYESTQSLFRNFFKEDKFDFDFIEKLPKYNSSKIVPDNVINADAILYFLNFPLSANDFLWLEKLPKNMPIWLVAQSSNGFESKNEIDELKDQISGEYINLSLIHI